MPRKTYTDFLINLHLEQVKKASNKPTKRRIRLAPLWLKYVI